MYKNKLKPHLLVPYLFPAPLISNFTVCSAETYLTCAKSLNLEWNIRRELAKAHYPMLKEAVIQNLLAGKDKAGFYLADEANLINELVFGMNDRFLLQAK